MCILRIHESGISHGGVVTQWRYLHFQINHIMLSLLQNLYVKGLVDDKRENLQYPQFRYLRHEE